jgi:prepilin-type N-terminal cleavage/methylation domain-containing protein
MFFRRFGILCIRPLRVLGKILPTKLYTLSSKRKLPSFTLMELMVVMVIISIVISSGALLYLQFNRYLEINLQQTGSENAIMLFTRAFKQDISIPGIINTGNYEIIITKKTGGQIAYSFEDNFIIRNTGEAIDTFKLGTSNLEIFSDPVTGEFRGLKTDLIITDVTYPLLIQKETENVDLFNKYEYP